MSKEGLLTQTLRGFGKWFEARQRVLPWRDNPDVYRVWISEIMLQQTQVATVVPYFERFLARFPTVEDLAAASEEEVMKYWAGLGYYSRARNIRAGAQQIVEAGSFPETREEWLEIPGVGDYTAGAILSIALDRVEPILDGNVERVVSRVRRVNRGHGDAAYKARLWRLSRVFVLNGAYARVRPRVLNQALMELGATVCTPKVARCEQCPLTAICRAHAEGDMHAYPPAKKPKEWVQVKEELHCWIDATGRMLLRLRAKGEWRAGLWDLMDEAPAKKSGAVFLGTIETKHVVTRHKVSRATHVWLLAGGKAKAKPRKLARGPSQLQLLRASEPEPSLTAPRLEGTRWVSLENPEVPIGSALNRALDQVRDRFGSAT